VRPASEPAACAGSIAEVLDLYATFGAERYDEAVGQLDHALQTAALAEADGADDALVVAALLHDVGHLLDLRATASDAPRSAGAVDLRHEDVGAAWLHPLLPSAVTTPIALHVRAKRYLCAVEPSYRTGLSAGSVASLERQGGPMSPAEAQAFETEPGWREAVRVRRWDDAGKVDELDVAPLRAHRARFARVVAAGG
jgi:[1-hydroxy-2-(trimethylamino)ethyl]phosphonate dioxygenase